MLKRRSNQTHQFFGAKIGRWHDLQIIDNSGFKKDFRYLEEENDIAKMIYGLK